MRDTEKRYILLYREAGFLDDAQFKDFVQRHFKGKGLLDVLKQEVSVRSFVDLMSLEIRVPFTGAAHHDPQLDKLLSAPNVTPDEIASILKRNQRDLKHLADMLLDAGLVPAERLAPYRRADWNSSPDVYEQFVHDGLLTPPMLEELAESGKTRYTLFNRMTMAINALVFNRLVKWEDVAAVLDEAGDELQRVPRLLFERNILTPARLIKAIGDQMLFPTADFRNARFPADVLELFPREFLHRNLFLPHRKDRGELTIFTGDPLNLGLFDAISIMTDLYVTPVFAPQGDIMRQLRALTEQPQQKTAAAVINPQAAPSAAEPTAAPQPPAPEVRTERDFKLEGMTASVDQRSTVALVTSIIDGAVSAGATDIHIEPMQDNVRVRYRVDGILHKVTEFPLEMLLPVVSRVKVLANMNVTERRRPQDGHFSFQIGNRHYDFRISSLPAALGEKVVIRVLDESRVIKGLAELGFEEPQLRQMNKLLRKPYGLILNTGPTGSGKTSTLYACLMAINDEARNIVTIEDPVEYSLAGINQVQVERTIDLSFANGLRSILRQDPDVIMIGEIRDPETAHIAIRASLTGHLVFSTLHTNTSAGAISALTNMGIQTLPLANALLAVLAQRLVRTVCTGCRRRYKPKAGVLKELGFDPDSFKKRFAAGRGCNKCFKTGYQGRTALYEILEVAREVRNAVTDGKTEDEIARLAFAGEDAITLLEAGRRKLLRGITTPEEVLDAVFI
ncbi:MAG: hypothetical protein Kow0059_16180 [Candidatus Sumerlaeia bacterium]